MVTAKDCTGCKYEGYSGNMTPCDICHNYKMYKPIEDNINNPTHYMQGKIEVIDFIEDQQLGFHEANVIKYVCRYKLKNGLEDVKKARWYLDRLIKSMEVDA